MITTEKNKKICEILGIHWHEWEIWEPSSLYYSSCFCGKRRKDDEDESHPNPDFTTDAGAVQLLRELEKYEKKKQFFSWLVCGSKDATHLDDKAIDRNIITTPGLLARKLVEWKG